MVEDVGRTRAPQPERLRPARGRRGARTAPGLCARPCAHWRHGPGRKRVPQTASQAWGRPTTSRQRGGERRPAGRRPGARRAMGGPRLPPQRGTRQRVGAWGEAPGHGPEPTPPAGAGAAGRPRGGEQPGGARRPGWRGPRRQPSSGRRRCRRCPRGWHKASRRGRGGGAGASGAAERTPAGPRSAPCRRQAGACPDAGGLRPAQATSLHKGSAGASHGAESNDESTPTPAGPSTPSQRI